MNDNYDINFTNFKITTISYRNRICELTFHTFSKMLYFLQIFKFSIFLEDGGCFEIVKTNTRPHKAKGNIQLKVTAPPP